MATKKQKSKKIVTLLRVLVTQAQTGAIPYEEFKSTSEILAEAFEDLLGSSYHGFSLSETFDLAWLDPDFYLQPNSFVQEWLRIQLGVRTEELNDENVAAYIYKALLMQVKDFKKVALIVTKAYPSLQELGFTSEEESPRDPATAGPIRGIGKLMELTLAPDSFVQEGGTCSHLSRKRTLTDSKQLITGERDSLHLPQNANECSLRYALLERCIPSIQQDGTFTELTVTAFQPWSTRRILDQPLDQESLTIYIDSYTYQDSRGNLHEYTNNNDNPRTLKEAQTLFKQIEEGITRAETPVATPARPRRRTGASARSTPSDEANAIRAATGTGPTISVGTAGEPRF